jgi:hypothetical protein
MRHPKEGYVGSSMQFILITTERHLVEAFLKACASRGVEIKWFGAREPVGFTSSWESWKYIEPYQFLSQTRSILGCLCDFRIPLTFSLEDCQTIAEIIRQAVAETMG